jgi:hypothetical protein
MRRIQSSRVRGLFAAAILALAGAPLAAQQPLPRDDSSVRPAALERSATRPTAPAVRFTRRPARVGDQAEQTIGSELRLTTSWRQGNAVVETTTSTMKSSQRRNVTTAEISDGRATAVVVRYLEAARGTGAEGEAAKEPSPQPVAGKTYRCRRQGEELIVTDAEGRAVPQAERELVAADMDALGRPNPLAEFLTEREVIVGETLSLPTDVADRLLGLGPEFGKLTRFDLTLRAVRMEQGVRSAVFQASVEAVSHDSSQMRLQVDGTLIVEIDACRAVKSSLAGPIGLSESRGSHSAAYQVFGTGKLSMSVVSRYRDAPQQ